jgi:hypothetical protein|tara:strand:+ start:333 stop:620 length:288 start_codon:yes stop_codon:yes gene_type:complete
MKLSGVLIPLKFDKVSENFAFKDFELIRFSACFHQTVHALINVWKQIQDIADLIDFLILVLFLIVHTTKIFEDFTIHISKMKLGAVIVLQYFLAT